MITEMTASARDVMSIRKISVVQESLRRENGSASCKPIIVGQGMQGDRAQVAFAAPGEISLFIRQGCP